MNKYALELWYEIFDIMYVIDPDYTGEVEVSDITLLIGNYVFYTHKEHIIKMYG